jgi:hypothetical protein
MAIFDLDTFSKVTGQTGNPFQAVGSAFGVPDCLLDLTKDALSLIPGDLLANLAGEVEQGQELADTIIKEAINYACFKTGIIEFDTESGTLKFVSSASKNKLDNKTLQGLKNLQGFLGAASKYLATGAQLYSNVQGVVSQIQAIGDCFDTFNSFLKFQSGPSVISASVLSQADLDELNDAEFGLLLQRIEQAKKFSDKCDNTLQIIGEILLERAKDPNKEPRFTDSSEFDDVLSGTNYPRFSVDDTPDVPDTEVSGEGVLRLTYGPPISTRGYFLLTKDGLYYDSQSGGLNPIFVEINSKVIPDGEKWKYEHDPSLGGKGQNVSLDRFKEYKDTLFDPNIIDDSSFLQEHYLADHFLQNITEQRDKHLWDLSAVLVTELANSSNVENSITKNLRLGIASELANHNSKIKRRKKQIEIAIKAPGTFDPIRGTPERFKKGEVPINDFSYLNDYNFGVEIEKQRDLFFKQGELDGIILPIETKYASPPARSTDALTINELIVPEIGIGDIIYSQTSSTSTILSLTDTVVTDKLFGIYNLLQPYVVPPSSTTFRITNTITNDQYNNIQLVANNASSVFVSGLSIPYLEGIVKNKSSNTALASALGSYLRLPDSKEFREFLYDPRGFTFECWVHAPNLTNATTGWLSTTTSSLTRAILANENTGLKVNTAARTTAGSLVDLDFLPYDTGDATVRGVIAGFTRDRRITQELTGYSNNNSDNNPASSLSFFIAPTQSRDASSCSWVNKANCNNTESFYKMKVDCSTRVNGKSFGDASGQFILVDIVGSPSSNEIKFYCDGQLMATSSISEVFGVPINGTIDIPSFKKANSFEYSSSSVDGPRSLKNGPKLNTYYTPWIVGGGYTDGMYQYGNFMGGDRGGIISGLRGFVGSLKFYSKPLTSEEVLTNYKAQQIYFKNILT